jgi:hypothetical protein
MRATKSIGICASIGTAGIAEEHQLARVAVMARTAPASAPAGVVPREFTGLARQLYRRLEVEYLAVKPVQERLIGEVERLVPRKGFRRLPIAATLRTVAAQWRAMPAASRLGPLKLTQHGEKLSIAEVRVVPCKMKYQSWTDMELVLGLLLIQIDYGHEIAISRRPLGDAGLHAVARRFERGTDRSDAAVLADLLELACAFPERAMAGGDFRVATRDGYWLGELVSYDGQPFLTARTFMDG